MYKVYKEQHFWFYDIITESFLLEFQRLPSTKIYEDPNNSFFKVYIDWIFINALKGKL